MLQNINEIIGEKGGVVRIGNEVHVPVTSREATKEQAPRQTGIEIKGTKSINADNRTKTYVQERGIRLAIANHWCKAVYYTVNGQGTKKGSPFVAVGFVSSSSVELRSKGFKSCVGPKASVLVKGSASSGILNVFEGFFDFLTALEVFGNGDPVPANDCYILNSTAMMGKLVGWLSSGEAPVYHHINAFLDRDTAGLLALGQLMAAHPDVNDRSAQYYAGFNDFNDWLMAKKRQNYTVDDQRHAFDLKESLFKVLVLYRYTPDGETAPSGSKKYWYSCDYANDRRKGAAATANLDELKGQYRGFREQMELINTHIGNGWVQKAIVYNNRTGAEIARILPNV